MNPENGDKFPLMGINEQIIFRNKSIGTRGGHPCAIFFRAPLVYSLGLRQMQPQGLFLGQSFFMHSLSNSTLFPTIKNPDSYVHMYIVI